MKVSPTQLFPLCAKNWAIVPAAARSFLHADQSFDPTSFDTLCIDSIARFKRPKDYVKLSELPKNNYGKVLKTELRKLLVETRQNG